MAKVTKRLRFSICLNDLNKALADHADLAREFSGKQYVTMSATIFDTENEYGNIGVVEIWHKESNDTYKLGKIKEQKPQTDTNPF